MGCKITKREKRAAGEWLYLEEIEYKDSKGKVRTWESAMRVQNTGAVLIIGELVPSNRVILVRQFRPPADGYLIEFPAGLIDSGEKPEETAIRELSEETGYLGQIREMHPACFSSPGLTGETVQIFKVIVDEEAEENLNVKPQFDEGEDIETFLVKKEELISFLKEREEAGDLIDSKVMSYALN